MPIFGHGFLLADRDETGLGVNGTKPSPGQAYTSIGTFHLGCTALHRVAGPSIVNVAYKIGLRNCNCYRIGQ